MLNLGADFFSYSLSKAALWDATRMMAQALAPCEIRVNGIGPGPSLAFGPPGPGPHSDAEVAATPAAPMLVQGLAEIAQALRYLIEASAVTGQMIAVDAGQHLSGPTPERRR